MGIGPAGDPVDSKYRVNSPASGDPFGGSVYLTVRGAAVGGLAGAWNMRVNSPPCAGLEGLSGGVGDWNILVNSPCDAPPGGGPGGCGCAAAPGLAPGASNMRVNSPAGGVWGAAVWPGGGAAGA